MAPTTASPSWSPIASPRPRTATRRVSNTATGDSDEVTPTTGSDTVAIVEDVDLAITKDFTSATVTAGGGTQTFTLTVQNSGVSDADNVVVTDSVDPRSPSLDRGRRLHLRARPDRPSRAPSPTWPRAPPRSITVTYSVASTTDSGTVSNEAFATSDEDIAPSSTDTVQIVEDVDLSIVKDFLDDTVTAGAPGSHLLTLVVHNAGVSDADDILVSDSISTALTLGRPRRPTTRP